MLLLLGCVLGSPSGAGVDDWNPVAGGAGIGGDAAGVGAPSSGDDVAEDAASSGDGGGSDPAAVSALEELVAALEEGVAALEDRLAVVESLTFTTYAPAATYVVTAEGDPVKLNVGDAITSPTEIVARCESGDVLLAGGCRPAFLELTYGATRVDMLASVIGSYPFVDGGKPVGWVCNPTNCTDGTYSGVTYTCTVVEPYTVYATCVAAP
jgi:hypothetical protein